MDEPKNLDKMAADLLARKRAEEGEGPDPTHVNPALDGPTVASGVHAGDFGIGLPKAQIPETDPRKPVSSTDMMSSPSGGMVAMNYGAMREEAEAMKQDYISIPKPLSQEEVAKRMAEGAAAQAPAMSMAEIAAQKMGSVAPATHEEVVGTQHIPTTLADEEETVAGTENMPEAPKYDDETIILGEDAINQVSDIPQDAKTKFFADLIPETQAYEKELVTKYGYTPAEAALASRANAGKKAHEFAVKWKEDHPEGVIITVDKSQEKTIEFTDEERAKMQEARALKLVVVEAAELETLTLADEHKIVPMSRLRAISSLSNYSIPLLTYGDYGSFRGAQSMKLAMSVMDDTGSVVEIIEKKASLLYEHFVGSTLLKMQHDDGTPLTYEEFCNEYKYDDVDMGVYAIVTASAMEITESRYVCQRPNCRAPYNLKYNQKALLDLSGIPDMFKDRIRQIDKFRDNDVGMKALHEECDTVIRIKSPFSNNVFEMNNPSIAQARLIAAACEAALTEGTDFDMALTCYLSKMWIWDDEFKNYIFIDVLKDPMVAFEAVCRLHQIDFRLLSDFIGERRYHPEFKIKVKCPVCGYEGADSLTVDGMVFLHARAIFPEIKS